MCNNAEVIEAFHSLDIKAADSELHSSDTGFLQ